MRTVDDVIGEPGWRGLIGQSTDLDELRTALASGPVTCYAGFEPDRPRPAHRPPGADADDAAAAARRAPCDRPCRRRHRADRRPERQVRERTLNPRAVVAGWVERIRGELERFIDPSAGMVVSNLEWTADLSAIALLRDVGKHFTVNRMLDRLIRSVEGAAAHALTIPLITKPDGTKFGKTEDAGAWLSA